MVQGLAELNRRWLAIPLRVREAVRLVMESTADEIVADMQRLVPVDTGALKASIGWTSGDAPKGTLTIGFFGGREFGTLRITFFSGGTPGTARQQRRASGTRKSDQKRTGSFDSDTARFQEFGTLKMPANPFFFPVWRVWRRRVKTRISRAITKALKAA